MAERIYSSHEVASLLQANPSTVIRWIDGGQLRAYRTPGGHRRVRERDLVSFLRLYEMPIPPELHARQPPRFLVVDDDAKFLKAVRRTILRQFPAAEIECCTSGIDAVLKVGIRRPDVVVLDIFMPGLDGVEVCRKIKQTPDTADIDVVAVTGLPSPELERKVREAGARTLLAKPFTGQELARAIGVE